MSEADMSKRKNRRKENRKKTKLKAGGEKEHDFVS